MTLSTSASTSVASAPSLVTSVTTSAPASTSAGLSSVASSITSASTQAQATGFSAQISALVASVVDTIRKFLASLPFVGRFFEKEAASSASTTAASSTNPATSTWTDVELVNMIKGQFVPAPATSSATAPAVPAADVVQYCLNLFGQITTPVAKMEAFQAVVTAFNSTDAITRDFYNALPGDLQTAFREQIWIANGRNDAGHGVHYGQHMVDTAIRGPLSHQAAANLLTALRNIGASSTGGSTTAGPTTGISTTGASSTGATTGP